MPVILAATGFQVSLLTAVAELLHANGVGKWLATGGTYGPTDTAITIDQLPSAPDRAIALSLYPVDDNSGGTDSTVGLQLVMRGGRSSPFDVKNTGDRAFDTLHDLKNTELGGIPIIRIHRQSGASLGTDGNGRQEASHNYYIQHSRPGAHRTD